MWKSLGCIQQFAIPCAVVCQAPPYVEFPSQEYWSGLPFPSPGDIPDPGIELRSPTLQVNPLPSEPPGMAQLGTIPKILKSVRKVQKKIIRIKSDFGWKMHRHAMLLALKVWEGGYKPRNMGGLWQLEKINRGGPKMAEE